VQALLSDPRLEMLPRSSTIIEILETVKPEPEVIDACRRLKDLGYQLALDDFVGKPGYEALIELTDIIKVDFIGAAPETRRRICERYRKCGIRMLAEKVETREEFQQALEMGYDYYQGYFFSRPVLMRGREIAGYLVTYLELLHEIHKPDLNATRVAELIQADVSMTHRLLRYINSAAFGRRGRISSVRMAISLLGEDEIRRWTWLAALPCLARNKPNELMISATVRARFCESLAPLSGLSNRRSDLFLMGMLSLLDAMLDQPLETVLAELRLATDIEEALLGKSESATLAQVFGLVRAYESADWDGLARRAARLGVPPNALPDLYLESVGWAEQRFRR